MTDPLPPAAEPDAWTYVPKPRPDELPRARRGLIALVAGGAVVVLLALAAGISYATTGSVPLLYKDPGIRACEGLRDKTQVADGYVGVRKMFASSHFQDIRDSGTKATDLIHQYKDASAASELGATLFMGGPMIEAYGSLVGACANHGIEIPPISQ